MALHLRHAVRSALRISTRSYAECRDIAAATTTKAFRTSPSSYATCTVPTRLIPATRLLKPATVAGDTRRGFAAKTDAKTDEGIEEPLNEPLKETQSKGTESDGSDPDPATGSTDTKGVPRHWDFASVRMPMDDLIEYHRDGPFKQARDSALASPKLQQMFEVRGINLERWFDRHDQLVTDVPEVYRYVAEAWSNDTLSDLEDALSPLAFTLLNIHRKAWKDVKLKPIIEIKDVSTEVLDIGPYPAGLFVGGGPKKGLSRLAIILGYTKALVFSHPLELRATVLVTSKEVHSAEADPKGGEEAAVEHQSDEVRDTKQIWTLTSPVKMTDWFRFIMRDPQGSALEADDDVELPLEWQLTDVNLHVYFSPANDEEAGDKN